MKAIKINCTNRTISIIEINNCRNICDELNSWHLACPMVFETNDVMYSNYYAGLYEYNGGFLFDEWDHPVLGDAIIIGMNEYGELSDVVITENELDKKISFISKSLAKKWFYFESNFSNKSLFSLN